MVETHVLVGRGEGGVGVQQFLVHFPAPGRLRTDVNIAESKPRENQPVINHHGLARRFSPPLESGNARIGQRNPAVIQFPTVTTFIETCLPERFVLVQSAQGRLSVRVLEVFNQVPQVTNAPTQQTGCQFFLAQPMCLLKSLMQITQGAMDHFLLDNPGQGFEILTIGSARH